MMLMKKSASKESITTLLRTSNYVRFGLIFCVTVVFTFILYPNLITLDSTYSIGDVAEKNIKAPFDFFVEDQQATEAKKNTILDNVITVYDHNSSLGDTLVNNINKAFELLREISEEAIQEDITPDITEDTSPDTTEEGVTATEDTVLFPEEQTAQKLSVHERIWQNKQLFEELLGIPLNDGAFRILEDAQFSRDISRIIVRILSEIMNNGVVTNKEILLRERDKGIILRNVDTQIETVVTNLKTFYGIDQAKTMVRVIGDPLLKGYNYTIKNLVVDVVQRLIQPNITLNINETEKRKTQATEEVKPVLYRIKAGEMVLREGERVTQTQLLKLNALSDAQGKESILKKSSGGVMIFLTIILISYILLVNFHKDPLIKDNKNLLFIAFMLISFFIFSRLSVTFIEDVIHQVHPSIPSSAILFGIPLSAASMTICIFMGLEIALPFAIIMSLFSGILLHDRFEIFIYHLLNSTMAAFWIKECRERKVFIIAGLKLGLLNVLLATVVCVYSADLNAPVILWSWFFAFFSGIGAGIITSGLSPFVEILFGYTTDITLLELANLDRPILRRLMLEAPGTYHHSVIVGSLVEAAASEIGSNPLLAKVCGYYHDIGKINKPLYFIENQFGGQNRHNKLAPSMSSLILISHVKDGVEIAKKHKLGQPIIDMIRQHHGTSLISFFYEKAKQLRGKENVKIDDFRYPGPKPQSIEAALVMLADVVEASSRTLEDPTPSRIQGHVQNLINKVFSDGQLDNCELTLKDLHNIAKSFIKILTGIYHHRIDYPDRSLPTNGKASNGSSDKQQPKQVQDASGENKAESPGGLRRLGLS